MTWISEWLLLYPDIEFNGRRLRSKEREVVNKMQKFCKEHINYTKDIIFAATKLYVEEYKARNYEYMRQAHFFISKIGYGSDLENYCEKIVAGQTKPKEDVIPTYNAIDDFI